MWMQISVFIIIDISCYHWVANEIRLLNQWLFCANIHSSHRLRNDKINLQSKIERIINWHPNELRLPNWWQQNSNVQELMCCCQIKVKSRSNECCHVIITVILTWVIQLHFILLHQNTVFHANSMSTGTYIKQT